MAANTSGDAVSAEAAEKALEVEYGAARRALTGWTGDLVFWLGAGYVVFHLVVLNIHPIDPWVFRTFHICIGSVIGFAIYGARASEPRDSGVPWYDWAMMAASVAILAYITVNLDELLFRAGVLPTTWDLVVGASGTFMVLELTRRSAGLALPILACMFILYAFVGPWMPGVLHHNGISADVFFSYIYSMQGIHGITTDVSATYIILFIAFACFLNASKAGDFFNDLSIALVGWARGGPAKVAVVSGILFGTISGSAVGNVVASGMITIPMMRRVGYDRSTAAAIEATSSTGGQITPPIMGAGAFIMAEILGIPYTDIAVAAIIPTLLFYIACYVHCDLHARKNDLHGIPRDELPTILSVLRRGHMLVPIVLLIVLMLNGYSVFRAGSVGIIAAVVASWLSGRAERMGPRAVLDTLSLSAREAIQLMAICACAGIIVGVIALTGIGGRFSNMVLGIAGESRFLALVFAMLIALVLGMGMPTTAAYAVAASVIAPGLAQMGIPPLTAHLFIFYYAVISAITPPVALASFAAAGMANADPWKTSFIALKLGLATFIVPFMFVYGPELLFQGEWLDIAGVLISASFGVFLLASSTEGWYAAGRIGWPARAVLFVSALCLIVPGLVTDLIGLGGAILVYAYQRLLFRRAVA
ncbi:MAG: TRAP transporter permease [Alphaproteobacteria bacterium]|nr:TRAP transporter permease [Alphaproteobacteria bacterium]